MNKILVILISLILTTSTAIISYGDGYTTYKDIKSGNWAYDAVSAMSQKFIVKGYPDGNFKPNNTVTYGEFIKMAVTAGTGEDIGNSKTGNWASSYYSKALELKYFSEYDINKATLNNQIPRSDMALIASAILGDIKIENYDEVQKGITDINYQTSHEYDITKAYASGVLTGYTDNTFKPEKTLTRAESAVVIQRLVDESKRVLPEVEKEPTGTDYKIVDTAAYFDKSPEKVNKVGIEGNTGAFTDKAELYTDASKFGISLNREWTYQWGSSFNHKLNGFIYLVKDGELVEYCQTTPRYSEEGDFLYSYGSMTGAEGGFDIRKADYIIVTQPERDNALLQIIANPLKK